MTITSRYTSIYMGQCKSNYPVPTLILYLGRPVAINESDFDTLLPEPEEVGCFLYWSTQNSPPGSM